MNARGILNPAAHEPSFSRLHPLTSGLIFTSKPSAASFKAEALKSVMSPNSTLASRPKTAIVTKGEDFHAPVPRRLVCIIVTMRKKNAATIRKTGSINQSHLTLRYISRE